jgi:hypothetical protein
MGRSLDDVRTMLAQARDVLLVESQRAGSDGDWEHGRRLFELARGADELAKGVSQAAAGLVAADAADDDPSRSVTLPPPGAGGRPASAEGYPKFTTNDEYLVKEGLQRGGDDIYQHAVPRARYEEILKAVEATANAATSRRRAFSIDQVQKRLSCPRYMTYVVVSMLLQRGLLVRARKGSYTFANPATFAADAANLWDQLRN